MLPSTRLVCWSSTTLSIPASRNSAWAQDRRTTSLVRSSSFIGPLETAPEAVADTADRMRRISAAGHRRRDLRPGVRHLTYGGILCSLALGGVKLAPPRSFAAPSEENPVAPVPIIDRDRETPPPSLEPLFRLLSGNPDPVNALIVD